MVLKVLLISRVQVGPVVNDQQVLGIAVFRIVCEVETAGDQRVAVDQHDFVVSNRMLGINVGLNSRMRQEIGGGILLGSLTLVEHHDHSHSALMGEFQGLRDRCRSKRIGLDQNQPLGVINLLNNRLRAASLRRKEASDLATLAALRDSHRWQTGCRSGGTTFRRAAEQPQHDYRESPIPSVP